MKALALNDEEEYVLTTDHIIALYKSTYPLGTIERSKLQPWKKHFVPNGKTDYAIEVDTGDKENHVMHYSVRKDDRDTDYNTIKEALTCRESSNPFATG